MVSPTVSAVSVEGNTKSSTDDKKKARQGLAKRWCFTFNNYTTSELSLIRAALDQSTDELVYIVGEEVGESGTPHLQGYVEHTKKIRPVEYFKWSKSIHWESARGTTRENATYCSKDGKFFTNIKMPKPLKLLKPEQFYDWQKDVVDIVDKEPDDRTIHWFYEKNGNRGKSALCKYLCAKKDALICSGKSADIKFMIVNYNKKFGVYPEVIIYDIPRTAAAYVSYGGLEEIKNGCFASSKYECEMVLMNSPHIICFSNAEPELEAISADRWCVREI